MTPNYAINPYCIAPEVQADGSVTFQCSQDARANPWLALRPHHPIAVQTPAFWAAVGASVALNGMEATKWSALTWMDWELGAGNGGHAVSGVHKRDEASENPSYELVLLNEAGSAIVSIQGRGVVFRTRNFEQWREGAKAEARKSEPLGAFLYADSANLGLTQEERVLVAPYAQGSDHIEALVTAQNGFPPGNPMIGGSGDHVNSTHLHEMARQALLLITGRTDIDTSGTMALNRYVELGTPIKLNIATIEQAEVVFEIEQVGTSCARITLRW